MGGKDRRRRPRLHAFQDTPPGWIRLVRCRACGRQASLPMEALVRRYGELEPLELALQALRCTGCGARETEYRMVRLCEPGCPRQRG